MEAVRSRSPSTSRKERPHRVWFPRDSRATPVQHANHLPSGQRRRFDRLPFTSGVAPSTGIVGSVGMSRTSQTRNCLTARKRSDPRRIVSRASRHRHSLDIGAAWRDALMGQRFRRGFARQRRRSYGSAGSVGESLKAEGLNASVEIGSITKLFKRAKGR
jgi:hypothetical protein